MLTLTTIEVAWVKEVELKQDVREKVERVKRGREKVGRGREKVGREKVEREKVEREKVGREKVERGRVEKVGIGSIKWITRDHKAIVLQEW